MPRATRPGQTYDMQRYREEPFSAIINNIRNKLKTDLGPKQKLTKNYKTNRSGSDAQNKSSTNSKIEVVLIETIFDTNIPKHVKISGLVAAPTLRYHLV